MMKDEFYVAVSATETSDWLDDDECWNRKFAGGDPIEKGYSTDYPSYIDALNEAQELSGEILVFSMEKPYKLISSESYRTTI